MLTAFCVRTRHTGIRNVFIVWNSDSLLSLYLNRDRKNSLGSKEVVVEELELFKKWLPSHIGEDGIKRRSTVRFLSREEMLIILDHTKSKSIRKSAAWNAMLKIKYGNQLVCNRGMITHQISSATWDVTCQHSASPSTLFPLSCKPANTFSILGWSLETHKNLFRMKISITANINPGKA